MEPDPRDGRFDDSVAHYRVARSLADGQGLAWEGTPTAGAPGYPLLLAAAFLFPGDDVAAGRALNILLGVALAAGVYYLGSRLFDQRAGLIAAFLMAIFPSNIFYTSLLLKEPVYAALMVGVLCLMSACMLREKASGALVLLLGGFIAFVSLLRPEGLALVPVFFIVWLAIRRRRARALGYAAVLILGMAAIYVPWVVRNAVQMHAFVVTPTGGGLVLLDTHDPLGTATAPKTLADSPSLRLALSYSNVPAAKREVRVNNRATRLAVTYFVHHLPRELELAPQRLAWFFRGDRDVLLFLRPDLSSRSRDVLGIAADVFYYGVIGLTVLTLPFWLRQSRSEHLLLWGPIAVYVLMWAFLFPGLPRYHSPLLAIFCVLAGIGATSFMDWWKQRRRRARQLP